MKLKPLPWLLILTVLCVTWLARRQLIEEQHLAFFCEAGGQSLACHAHHLIVAVFYNNDIMGYISLLLGGLAVYTCSGWIGLVAGTIGIISLIFHNGEFAAIGFLLGILTLARSQFSADRAQHGSRQ
jgi:hypothetical protein